MVNNKADTIENYILEQLSGQQNGTVELKRTELADLISCAPSQISYVLSTRFTNARGFRVESQRGLGGYIRIAVVTDAETQKQMMYRNFIENITAESTFEDVKSMLDIPVERKIISRREGELVARTISNFYDSENAGQMSSEERAKLTRSIFHTLAKIT